MPERLFYTASATFESARRIPGAGQVALRTLHGHSFAARLRVAAPAIAAFPGGQVDALRARLQACVAPLDYADLNACLDDPTDEKLARWVRARLELPGIDVAGVRSTPAQGVDLDAGAGAHLWRRYQFESAHRLPHVAPGHKCGRMHGHGFAVIVHAQAHPGAQRACLDAGLDARLDITALDRLWAPLHAQLHQACLNDIEGLDNPTSEHIARWIWQRLRPQLQALRWVTVYETATCGAHFDGANYRIWKELGFDSAMRLQRAPAGDGRRRIHGHSYRLRLHLAAPLDQVLGWTIDFGDVKECFAPVLARLDHHPLHELPGVGRGGDRGGDDGEDGAAAIVRWVRGQTAASLPALERIDLDETPGCGVVLCWGPALPALPV